MKEDPACGDVADPSHDVFPFRGPSGSLIVAEQN